MTFRGAQFLFPRERPHLITEISSTISEVRLRALQRLSVLYGWRHQILSQTYLPDRNHRRPFKLAAKPVCLQVCGPLSP